MFDGIQLEKYDGDHTLSFDCATPVDHVVVAAGDEPNGHFWEGVVSFVAPALVDKLELDSEGSMFSVSGKRRHLKRLRRELEPLLNDPIRLRSVLDDAEAQGVPIEG